MFSLNYAALSSIYSTRLIQMGMLYMTEYSVNAYHLKTFQYAVGELAT